jgi:hypothetical protein
MPPPIAKSKSDAKLAKWGRMQVEATVRAWFGFMSVDQSKMQQIRKEWESLFNSLPADRVARIVHRSRTRAPPDVEKPSNSPISRGSWTGPPWPRIWSAPIGAAIDGPWYHGALENPPVDPLHGNGRTAASVARELREYHAWQRLQPSAQPALFQADYILCMPPGHSLGLRRVASGAFLEDANAPILSFQTVEYVHRATWRRLMACGVCLY